MLTFSRIIAIEETTYVVTTKKPFRHFNEKNTPS
jgi:hypothetical protein